MRRSFALCLALLLAGCNRDERNGAGQDVGVDAPKIDPNKALKLTVDPPAQTGPLQGPIQLKVWLENISNQSLVICRRLDGSGHVPWPTYELHFTDAAGRELKHDSYRKCGTCFPLKKTDFLRLGPGEKVDIFPFLELNMSDVTYASEYPALDSGGSYTLTVTYRMADMKGGRDPERDMIEPEAAPLLREAFRGEIVSAPVALRFSN